MVQNGTSPIFTEIIPYIFNGQYPNSSNFFYIYLNEFHSITKIIQISAIVLGPKNCKELFSCNQVGIYAISTKGVETFMCLL